MSERSVIGAKAAVVLYDDASKKWVPSGGVNGPASVVLYTNDATSQSRVVGRRLQDKEVVINSCLYKGMKYNQATPTFHQWRDVRGVYGLNFQSKDEAAAFADAIQQHLQKLGGGTVIPPKGAAPAAAPAAAPVAAPAAPPAAPPAPPAGTALFHPIWALLSTSCREENRTPLVRFPCSPAACIRFTEQCNALFCLLCKSSFVFNNMDCVYTCIFSSFILLRFSNLLYSFIFT
eukprot:scpid93647/ scgid3769/ Protein enabled